MTRQRQYFTSKDRSSPMLAPPTGWLAGDHAVELEDLQVFRGRAGGVLGHSLEQGVGDRLGQVLQRLPCREGVGSDTRLVAHRDDQRLGVVRSLRPWGSLACAARFGIRGRCNAAN